MDGLLQFYVPNFAEESSNPDRDYTIFEPGEIELNEMMKSLYDLIERLSPRRAVFDSVSEMRLLARDPLRYRRHVIGLKNFFAKRNCTVIFTNEAPIASCKASRGQSYYSDVIRLPEWASETA